MQKSCKICNNAFNDNLHMPKKLKCGCIFCQQCVGNTSQFTCPIDGFVEENSTDLFKSSDYILPKQHKKNKSNSTGLVSINKSLDNSYISDMSCSIPLSHIRGSVAQFQYFSENSQELLCQRHTKIPVELFCTPCDIYICYKCTFLDHKGHNYHEIPIAVENFRSELQKVLDQLDELKANYLENIQYANQQLISLYSFEHQYAQELQNTYQQTQKQIQDKFVAQSEKMRQSTFKETIRIEQQKSML